jgi:hypothetical protein
MSLGLVFGFLAFDEYAVIHERLILPTQETLGVSGLFYFALIIPYGVALFFLPALVFPTILKLSPHPRRWFILSSVAYLSGALGFEAIGGWRFEQIGGEYDRSELIYQFIATAEEGLEMIGLVLLTYALLEFIRLNVPTRLFRLRQEAGETGPASGNPFALRRSPPKRRPRTARGAPGRRPPPGASVYSDPDQWTPDTPGEGG